MVDMLKLRASWGRVGDDAVVAPWQRFTAGRFLYKDQLSYGGNTVMGSINPDNSPYTHWKISSLGNPDVSWETVEKRNIGSGSRCSKIRRNGTAVTANYNVRTGIVEYIY